MSREIEITRQREMIEMAREMRAFSRSNSDTESEMLWTRQINRAMACIRRLR